MMKRVGFLLKSGQRDHASGHAAATVARAQAHGQDAHEYDVLDPMGHRVAVEGAVHARRDEERQEEEEQGEEKCRPAQREVPLISPRL